MSLSHAQQALENACSNLAYTHAGACPQAGRRRKSRAGCFALRPPARAARHPRFKAGWGIGVTDDEVLAEFRAADALLEGHFILSSGRHSSRYLQCARVLMDPRRGARLAEALVAKLPGHVRDLVEAVVSPAMGGIIAGQEVARALGVEAMFLERPTGTFELRRGFRLREGQRVLMMEDVVTTGLSSIEAISAIHRAGGEVVAAAALVDRSGGAAELGVPFFPLIRLEVPSYAPDALPPELASVPAIKPGSRAAA
jgi:orotate phosphoribosyltransferase